MASYFKHFRQGLQKRRLPTFLKLALAATLLFILSLFAPWDLDRAVAAVVLALLIWIIYRTTEAAFLSAEAWMGGRPLRARQNIGVTAITLAILLATLIAAALFVAIVLMMVSRLGWVDLK